MRPFPALLLLLVSILACDSDSPTQPEDPIPFQDRPFYYFEDVPEYLEIDPHWLTGATVVSRAEWDSLTYILSFPDGSKHTPLEIAAFTDQQPGVDHATPNFVFRIEGPPPPASMAKGRMPRPM